MKHLKKVDTLIFIFIFNLLFIPFAYPQIDPQSGELLNKVVNKYITPKFSILKKPLHDYRTTNNITDFDSILAFKFQYVLDSILAANNVIGASAAIIMPEKGTWLGVSGMSDPETEDSIRSDMLFDIGSNTKTFIAAQILLLAEQGLLTLDDSLYQWLPSFPNIDSTITIRQLLNHTSGIGDFINENPAWYDSIFSDPDKFWTPEYSLTYVLEPNFSPGEGWSYSNTGYILAGMIIKQATGSDSVSSILRQQILDPFNLNNTFLDIEEVLIGDLAHGWFYNDVSREWYDYSQIPRTSCYSSLWTCGAMVSTSRDMAEWVRLLYAGEIINHTSLNEMFTLIPSPWPDDPEILGYGLGTMKCVWFGEELWLHGGDTFCYGSQAAYYPVKDVSIVVLVNQRNFYYQSWYSMITEQLFRTVLDYYNYPHDKLHPYDVRLSKTYVRPDQDTLNITAQLYNPEDHNVHIVAKVISLDSTYIDSTILFDDGDHDDGQFGDILFGGYIDPIPIENEFLVSINTVDLDSNYSHTLKNATRFTTIGPVTVEEHDIFQGDTLVHPGDKIRLRLILRNEGLIAIASNITTELSCPDASVSIKPMGNLLYHDILSGETATTSGYYSVDIADNCPSGKDIPFYVHIASENYTFWYNTFSVHIYPPSIITEKENIPRKFTLNQNFPNPFNPATKISYYIPQSGLARLKIYNILGQDVKTLVNQFQKSGEYTINFDASNLASGIYFYQLQVGSDYVQTKKMILMR